MSKKSKGRKATSTKLNFFGAGEALNDRTVTSNKLDDLSAAVITGFGVPRDAVTGITYEFEWNNNYIAFSTITTVDTAKYPTLASTGTLRMVWKGDFKYSNGQLKAARVDEIGLASFNTKQDTVQASYRWIAPNKPIIEDVRNPYSFGPPLWNNARTIADYSTVNGAVQWGTEVSLQPFGNGNFFPEGWQNDAFKPNLI